MSTPPVAQQSTAPVAGGAPQLLVPLHPHSPDGGLLGWGTIRQLAAFERDNAFSLGALRTQSAAKNLQRSDSPKP